MNVLTGDASLAFDQHANTGGGRGETRPHFGAVHIDTSHNFARSHDCNFAIYI